MKPLVFFISLLVFALILLGVRDYVRHKQVMGERVEALEADLKAIKTENDDCLVYALESIKEAREIVVDAFKDKLLIPLAKDWFLVMDTEDAEKGLAVEFRE